MYENKLNHKKYIGQSTNIARRYEEHLMWPSKFSRFDNELKAIGIEGFNFTVLEECQPEQLDERESYWIQYYDSYTNGYNLTLGGQSYRGQYNPKAKLQDEDVQQIIILLEEHKLNNQQIADMFLVSRNTIDGINRCLHWTHLHNYHKNIRQENLNQLDKPHTAFAGENSPTNKITEQQALLIIKLLEQDNRSMVQLSRDLSISINIIQDINRCKTWKYLHNYKNNIRKEYKGGG